MKKLLLTLMVAVSTLTATAQQFVVVNGQAILADDIQSITYQTDPDFHVLPEAIALDEKLQLFSQALQLTGLADSLVAYFDYDYDRRYEDEQLSRRDGLYYTAQYQYVKILSRRHVKFTVFAETDSTFAANGISSLADLQAFAKRVYDDVYPEDASITDPTDRRHSLNRFVAYHLLPFNTTPNTLTAYPGFFRRQVADVADWYPTMMPHASLKVANPGNIQSAACEYYLNRRGVQDRADKYGIQIRGAKVIQTATAANGTYYHIDDLLVYDRQTQEVVLQERWRIDAVTLSPDFMNAESRTNIVWNGVSSRDPSMPAIGFVTGMKNISWNEEADVFIQPIRYNYWSFGGDEVDFRSDNNFYSVTVDLPSMPAGEWELRLGTCIMGSQAPVLQFTLDDGSQLDSVVNLAMNYDSFSLMGWTSPSNQLASAKEIQQSHRPQIDGFLSTLSKKYLLPMWYNASQYSWDEDFLEKVKLYYIPADSKTISQLIDEKVLVQYEEDDIRYMKDNLLDVILEERTVESDEYSYSDWYIQGTEQTVDPSARRRNYEQAFIQESYRLNGWLPGPKEYASYSMGSNYSSVGNTSNSQTFDNIPTASRRIIGRFKTDGRTDHKLRIQTFANNGGALDFDYLELCPVSIADHPTIPED